MDSRQLAAQGRRFAIATPHLLATRAAVEAFEAGGNAVDAAVTANAVLAVVYPHMCGIGGDLFAIVADSSSKYAVNGSGALPAAIDVAAIRKAHATMPARGPLSISVPGTLAAWDDLITRFGRRSFADAIRPAIDCATTGAPVTRSVARAIASARARIDRDLGLRGVFAPNGAPLGENDLLRQPALAESLGSIADLGVSAFYDGSVGARLILGLRKAGSPMTTEDFRRHRTEVLTPLTRRYRAHEILVPPPNSQGFVLEEILGCIERGDIIPDHLSDQAPFIAKVFRLASADRDRFLADPRRARVPIDELLSANHASDLLRQMTAPPGRLSEGGSGDTVGIVAADADGLWVSINQSLFDSFGAGFLEPETGIICQNRGSGASLDPLSPNIAEGGKRPAHTLMPVMTFADGAPAIASATMGRNAHAQIHAELLMAVIDQRINAFEAVDRPRWLVGGLRADAAGVVAERRVPDHVIEDFHAAGITADTLSDWDEGVGHAMLIARARNGELHAASDPRSDGAAAAD
jgi:gamma-glutamyltranspeptidase